MSKDRYGCNNYKRGTGMCENSATITRQKVEERVLSCLQSKLMAPERVNAFMTKVQQQIKAVRSESAAKHSHLKKRLTEAEKSLESMLDLAESGRAPLSILDRIQGREDEIAALKAELAAAMPDSNVIGMMPDLAKVYERKVEELSAALNDPAVKTKATEVIRQLIHQIVMTPDATAPDGMRMEVSGLLAEIMALAGGQDLKEKLPGLYGPGSQLSVDAGARNRRDPKFMVIV